MFDDDGNFTTGLTPAETELLALLIEECGEVIQAASKVLRHGWDSYDPTRRGERPTNQETLAKEMGQLEFAMLLLKDPSHPAVRYADVADAFDRKRETIGQWLHFNADRVPRVMKP